MHYFRARMWNDKSGRFIQRDPIGYVDGLNLYNGYFVLNGFDPTGEASYLVKPRVMKGVPWTEYKETRKGKHNVRGFTQVRGRISGGCCCDDGKNWRFYFVIDFKMKIYINKNENGNKYTGGDFRKLEHNLIKLLK